MKSAVVFTSVALVTVSGLLASQSAQAIDTPWNSIRVGVMAGGLTDSTAVAGTVEYERFLTDSLSLGVRLGKLSYDTEYDSYKESGDGTGVDAALTLHFGGNPPKGPYLGFHVGYWSTDWEWTDPTDNPKKGKGSSNAANVSATFGWKIPLGDSFLLQPSLTVGDYLSSATDDTNTQEQELGFYALLGLALGFSF